MLKIICLLWISSTLVAAKSPDKIQGTSLATNTKISWSITEASGPTALIFLSAVCPCSKSHLDYLRKLKELNPKVTFIGIHANQDEGTELTKKYFINNPLPFEVIEDENAALANELKAFKTPHAFLFSPTGELLYSGGVTNSSQATSAKQFFLQDAITDFLHDGKVKVKEGRPLGCIISRAK
jgi:hypothetical protein